MPGSRPNVLFIPVDDLRPQLGCYGRDHMITPRIDGLAEQGVVFTRAYCQVPVCGATRASLLTGVRPTRQRFTNYKTWVDQDLPGALTLPEHFRKQGYETVSVGKVFHHRTDAAERSWSRDPWHPSTGGNWRNYLKKGNIAVAEARGGKGPPFECADVPDNAYFDGQIADRAIRELHRLKEGDRPFFLAAGFIKPHLPFNAPKRYWDYYRHDDVDLADNPCAPMGAPAQALHNWGELRQYTDIPAEGPLPEEMARSMVHGYYAATSFVDAQVGRLLVELDRTGLRESTIVVLWGDHGWQLGEHGLWCKHCNFNTSLNAPLVVSAPDVGPRRPSSALVEFADVFPTLCDLAALPVPEHLEGTSLVPVLEEPERRWKQAVFSRYMRGDSVRTDQHLYTRWTADDGTVTARMLYDHGADPDENLNVSELPANEALVRELEATLTAGWQAVGPLVSAGSGEER